MKLIHGDCLVEMQNIPDKSIDMVLCDLPYGVTSCKWDIVIPFEPLWKQYERIIKDNGAIVLFGCEPFSSHLRLSNLGLYRYDIIWDKVNLYTGAFLANKMPMKRHENISVFYKKQPTYNKQYRQGQAYKRKRKNAKGVGEYASSSYQRIETVNDGNHNPCSILQIEGGNRSEKGFHPTQKPVALLEYLIKTYSNEGETILDNTMGSGSTGVACVKTNRDFIGIELNEEYFKIAEKRINIAVAEKESTQF
jgi:site-specific DNA-methyltransferase (adenine-specific)